MSTGSQDAPVVVGVDGSTDNLGALRYAATEAAATGAPLRLVHVVPDYMPVSPMLPQTPVDLAGVGAAILGEAKARASAVAPDVEIEERLHHGTRSVQLVRAAEDARVLVVGRDERSLVERLLRGDTATAAAARASVPVVEVPASWQHNDHGRIVVGVKSPRYAAGLLADAFEIAARREVPLVILHAWKLPSAYDDIIEVRVDLEAWRREATEEMEALVRDWRLAYPNVKVELQVVHDHPAHALVEASRTADLVMMVRRAHGMPAATHLGGIARALLRASHCPVRVVAPAEADPMPLVLERGGRLAR